MAKTKKPTSKAPDTTHTKPALRGRLKTKLLKGSKGGKPGQWSARKAQLLATEYKAAGGGYRGGKKATQKHLDHWTAEKWQTAKGTARARHGKTTDRYLPKQAWASLTPAERKATDAKKQKASREGQQFVANTKRAKAAGKRVRKSPARKPKATSA